MKRTPSFPIVARIIARLARRVKVRWVLLFIGVLGGLGTGCSKEAPVETVPPTVLEPDLVDQPTVDPATRDAITHSRQTVGAATGISSFPDGIRAPLASDLSHYVADLGPEGALLAVIETSEGTIRCQLYDDKTPMTVANFVGLARGLKPYQGRGNTPKPFYDGLLFHRVIPRFMIQGGDPKGDGTGGPGYQFDNEIHPLARHDGPGTLAMANSGPDTNGSQFYITERAHASLDDKYTVFGRCKNVDVVRTIARVESDEKGRPKKAVIIKQISIIRGAL